MHHHQIIRSFLFGKLPQSDQIWTLTISLKFPLSYRIGTPFWKRGKTRDGYCFFFLGSLKVIFYNLYNQITSSVITIHLWIVLKHIISFIFAVSWRRGRWNLTRESQTPQLGADCQSGSPAAELWKWLAGSHWAPRSIACFLLSCDPDWQLHCLSSWALPVISCL